MSSRLRWCVFPAVSLLVGCSFEAKSDANPNEMNMCKSATDCTSGSDCVDGMCQAQAADETLTIALQVTPLHMPNGADPLPIALDPFHVSEPIKDRQFALPSAVVVSGTVRVDAAPIDADVTFMPIPKAPGVAPTAITASIAATSASSASDFQVRLLKGVDYRMVVRPMGMGYPPYALTFTAGSKVDLSVDFATLDTKERTFAISGAPSDRELVVTAFDPMSGEAVSSTATVKASKATLLFAPAAPDTYRLEIRASQTYDQTAMMMPSDPLCDTDTPAFPVFSLMSSDLGRDANGRPKITLPKEPARIRYEGTVDLCPDEAANVASAKDLPITLHAQSLLFDGTTKLAASFDTTTSASYDPATKVLHFCVEVLAGDYDVVATPPASMRCALFAERRTIKPPNDTTDLAGGALLSLPEAAYLSGKLQTMGPVPLSGASIEAVALGESEAVPLPPDDLSVTRYNRSSQTTTNDDGSFKLPVDLGAYDVVIKPPADSGFPWQVNHDIKIGVGARKAPISNIINMPSPVVVTGTLRYPGASDDTQATLDGAEIDAYAIILVDAKDPMGAKRAVAIGKATADSAGMFMLLLPPNTEHVW